MFVHDTWHYQKRNLSYLKVIYLLWCRSPAPFCKVSLCIKNVRCSYSQTSSFFLFFFFCFLYMWQVLRSQKNAPNPFACFTNGKMMFSVLFYFVLNSEDDEG